MRAIVQRVKKASVEVGGQEISAINKGLLVLLGVGKEDSKEDASYMAEKISNLRIFTDEDDKMNLSVKDVGGEVLVVSQFTLYGDVRKGRRPSYTESAGGEFAENLYEDFVSYINEEGLSVQKGVFGADMQVSLINDGPVTIQIDSDKLY